LSEVRLKPDTTVVTPMCVVSAFRRTRKLGEPEVEDLHRPIVPNLDVGGLQIAVDDTLFVRGFERLGNLSRDGERLIDGDATFGNAIRARVPLAFSNP
jgi:hypothetical protein